MLFKTRTGQGDGPGHEIAPAIAAHCGDASQLPNDAETDYLFAMSDKPRRPRKHPGPRIAFDVPGYVLEQVKDRALKERATIRIFMLDALKAYGIDIKDEDFIADRRLLNRGGRASKVA